LSNHVRQTVPPAVTTALTFSPELNPALDPLLKLLDTAPANLHSAIAEILFGIAQLRGSARELVYVADSLQSAVSQGRASAAVSVRLSTLLRALNAPRAEKKEEAKDEKEEKKEEKKDEKEESKEAKESREAAAAAAVVAAEAKERLRLARLRRRTDRSQWPWHPDLATQVLAPSDAKEGVSPSTCCSYVITT